MNLPWQNIIWQQFGAAIDDLENTIRACPADLWYLKLWDEPQEELVWYEPYFWYLAYHTLYWLDLQLTGAEEGFAPPPPFVLIEQQPGDPMPDPYTRQQLLDYLDLCRQRCRETIENLTEETAGRICTFPWGRITFAELQLYNMRHVQGHTAQLNMALGQHGSTGPAWVARAEGGKIFVPSLIRRQTQ